MRTRLTPWAEAGSVSSAPAPARAWSRGRTPEPPPAASPSRAQEPSLQRTLGKARVRGRQQFPVGGPGQVRERVRDRAPASAPVRAPEWASAPAREQGLVPAQGSGRGPALGWEADSARQRPTRIPTRVRRQPQRQTSRPAQPLRWGTPRPRTPAWHRVPAPTDLRGARPHSGRRRRCPSRAPRRRSHHRSRVRWQTLQRTRKRTRKPRERHTALQCPQLRHPRWARRCGSRPRRTRGLPAGASHARAQTPPLPAPAAVVGRALAAVFGRASAPWAWVGRGPSRRAPAPRASARLPLEPTLPSP